MSMLNDSLIGKQLDAYRIDNSLDPSYLSSL